MKFAGYIPFVEHLGMELLRAENGEAGIALELRDELCNSWAVALGGGTLTLMDMMMAFREAPIVNTQNELLAQAIGTFKFIRQAPNGGRKLARLYTTGW